MNYLLSIIIPTKDRYTTLIPVVEFLLDMSSLNCEILVQDNSNDNSVFLEFLSKNNFDNLSYYHLNDNLSQTENSDLAVNNSKGEFVCFIGDDDFVMPYIEDVALWMKKSNITILKANKPQYYWPKQQANYISTKSSGIIKYTDFTYKISKIKSIDALNFTLDKGGSTMKMLPCLYHGIVKRSTLDKIFEISKSYFPGPSPDMANGISLTLVEDSYSYIDFPVVLSGKSVHSIGGQGVLHNHVAKIEDVKHLPEGTAREWSSRIPKYWTGPTIWSESVVQALKRLGNEKYLSKMNYSYLYASLFVFNYKQRKAIFKDFKYPLVNRRYFYYVISILSRRSLVFIKNHILKNQLNQKSGVLNPEAAISIISNKVDLNRTPL